MSKNINIYIYMKLKNLKKKEKILHIYKKRGRRRACCFFSYYIKEKKREGRNYSSQLPTASLMHIARYVPHTYSSQLPYGQGTFLLQFLRTVFLQNEERETFLYLHFVGTSAYYQYASLMRLTTYYYRKGRNGQLHKLELSYPLIRGC